MHYNIQINDSWSLNNLAHAVFNEMATGIVDEPSREAVIRKLKTDWFVALPLTIGDVTFVGDNEKHIVIDDNQLLRSYITGGYEMNEDFVDGVISYLRSNIVDLVEVIKNGVKIIKTSELAEIVMSDCLNDGNYNETGFNGIFVYNNNITTRIYVLTGDDTE